MELALCEDIHELGIFVDRDIRWEMKREHLSIVVRENNEIVASSSLLQYPNGWKVEHTLVADSHRGRGLFRAIMGELIHLVRPDPVWAITRATGAFTKSGFRVVGGMMRSVYPRIPTMERALPSDELVNWRQQRTRLALVGGHVTRVNRFHWRYDGTRPHPWFFPIRGWCPVVCTEDVSLDLNALHQMW